MGLGGGALSLPNELGPASFSKSGLFASPCVELLRYSSGSRPMEKRTEVGYAGNSGGGL